LLSGSILAGRSAAWLYRIDVDPLRPAEVIVPIRSGIRSRPGLNVHRVDLRATDTVCVRGLRTTSPGQTLYDLCRRLNGVELLIVLDAALRLKLTDTDALVRLSALGAFAEPAESPMETRLRWRLIQAGLPRPQVQAPLPVAHGRADLYYPDSRLAIEYDGLNH
jgi:hypothetical protein